MKSTVKEVVKGFSNTPLRIPYSYILLDCGHSLSGELAIGESIECTRCDEQEKTVAEIIAFSKTPEFSHLVVRDLTASKTGEWMSFLAYRRDPTSPTQCHLALGVEANERTEKALHDAGLIAHLGPTRGAIAEGWGR